MSMVKKIVLSQGTLAILAAGTAAAGVSGLSVSHSSNVGVLFEIGEDKNGDIVYNTIGDENFSVTGGDELLNFDTTVHGGWVNSFGGDELNFLTLTSSGSLTPEGGFTHSNYFSTGVSEYGGGSGDTQIAFTVSEEATLVFFLDYLTYNNDSGSGMVELKNLDTDEQVFVFYDYSDDESFEAMLGAGNYALSVSSRNGSLSYSFDVNPVPSPSAMGLLGLGGLCTLRRRR